ncbi:ring-cleaving dioxygenase (plasmid) [Agrobacterium leguminum]|uniref:Ring-cleaving dioxygenase MhqA n=1 Tax=Agrobacterium deltaense NCPPB 1641 TaxID=1183425 RepID=A0A1S7U9C1_9HYPH|nr:MULTISPECIES: ring-cleaving dioxygenase [Agrobacterium]WFS70084.1 ring-cleaving dioxygenase [Agrobacterium leguminum]CVI63463.1 putative ring-cleaving dioxygenase MhqA [Agrobacterium deltaense NCPPB 1641]
MDLHLTGIHHLTAITANAAENLRFYTQVLGMRLVKKTVNQDDTTAYHLFYADGVANPGTDLTFFDWPVGRERRGTHSVTRTGLRVGSRETLVWWKTRFDALMLASGDIEELDGRASLDFEDFEGQRFRLIDDGAGVPGYPWEHSSVPSQHQIKGLGPIVMSVPDISKTGLVLTRVMNMTEVRVYASPDGVGDIHVFSMGEGGPSAELHVAVQDGRPAAGQGAGGVHHVAFRTPDAGQLNKWAERLKNVRLPSSGEVERFYFRSLYFREPGGVLFEIATDGPGFAVDEPLESLGETLSLPPFLEAKREQIEARLKPLR